jgi:hypothetical protein
MQNPKKRLERGHWYHVASQVTLRKTKSAYSKSLTKIEPGALVMFLEYHTGSVRVCKVGYRDYIGWIVVDLKYKEHLHFFKKVKTEDVEDRKVLSNNAKS